MILSRISLNDISFTESLNLRDLLTRHEIWVSILVAFHSTFGFIFGNSLIIGFLLNMNQLHSWIHNWVKGNFGNAHDGPTPSWFWSPISPNSHECWIFLTLNTKEKESYCVACIKDIQVTLDQTGFFSRWITSDCIWICTEQNGTIPIPESELESESTPFQAWWNISWMVSDIRKKCQYIGFSNISDIRYAIHIALCRIIRASEGRCDGSIVIQTDSLISHSIKIKVCQSTASPRRKYSNCVPQNSYIFFYISVPKKHVRRYTKRRMSPKAPSILLLLWHRFSKLVTIPWIGCSFLLVIKDVPGGISHFLP